MAVSLIASIAGCVTETEPVEATQEQAVAGDPSGCDGLQRALENCPNTKACETIEALLAAHGCVAPPKACPCFDLPDLLAITGTVYGQQRFLNPDGSGLNWVGALVGGTGFGQVYWDPAGTGDANRCYLNDWSAPQTITYEQALACDDVLNQYSLAVGAHCGSLFCP